jgi:hypothetical protein
LPGQALGGLSRNIGFGREGNGCIGRVIAPFSVSEMNPLEKA